MSFQPLEFVSELNKHIPEIRESLPGTMNAYLHFNHEVFAEGKLTSRTKELIALAISLSIKCPYCIALHVKKSLELGITKEEMMEAAAVAIEMSGAPAVTYTSMMLKAIEELTNKK